MSETVFPQPQNVLDSTVARIASAVENMVPSNVCVNISTSLLPADWSSTAPYIQVWTNNKVTDECAVKVEFPAEAASTNVTYLEFEKVAGGVKFTAPVKPATAIPVIVHIINAEAESITDISADLVSTSAVPNASNVEEGLETLSSDVTALNSKITNITSHDSSFTSQWVTGYYILGRGLVIPSMNYQNITITSAKIFLNGNWENISSGVTISMAKSALQNDYVLTNTEITGMVTGTAYLIEINGSMT